VSSSACLFHNCKVSSLGEFCCRWLDVFTQAWTSQMEMGEWVTTRYLTLNSIADMGRKVELIILATSIIVATTVDLWGESDCQRLNIEAFQLVLDSNLNFRCHAAMSSSVGSGRPDYGSVAASGKLAGWRDLAGGAKPEFPSNVGDCDHSRPLRPDILKSGQCRPTFT